MNRAPALSVVTYSLATGGSERIAADVARHMAATGLPTTVCATHGGIGPVGEALLADGIDCVGAARHGEGRFGRAWRLFRHFRSTSTTIVHVHHFNMLAAAYHPARWAGVNRIVVTEHSDYQMRNRPGALARARRFGPRADAVTVVHDGLAAYLRTDVGLPSEAIRVIPNGVDTRAFQPGDRAAARREAGLPAEGLLAGSVGRLHPDKAPRNLIAAMARVPADAGIRAVLVGDGPERAEVERTIAAAGVGDRVLLLGERHDVPTILRALDLFVLPSRTEGLPVALLEAMSCGIPVVATDVGGVRTAVGDGGVTVAPGDPEALASAIASLAGDPDARADLGARGRRRAVEHYDRSVMFRAYERVLMPEREEGEC